MGNPFKQFIKGFNNVREESRAKKDRVIKVVMPNNRGSENREALKTGIRAIGKGFQMAGKSLATPTTSKRPKISQMPGSRSEMDIVRKADQRSLKPNGMQNRDIRGRRIK